MTTPDTEVFFEEKQQILSNATCCDSGAVDPLWASVSHGIYISIEAAGVHRSLGVSKSFVLSLTLDRWQPLQLRMMELGGNKRFQDFLELHGIPKSMPVREKYGTRAAAWYRENLRAEAEGTSPPEPLSIGAGHLAADVAPDPAQAVLDRVFASLHCNEELKMRSMIVAADCHEIADPTQWKRRCLVPAFCHWACEQLRNMVDFRDTEGYTPAHKLKDTSDVCMESFGIDKCVSKLTPGRDS